MVRNPEKVKIVLTKCPCRFDISVGHCTASSVGRHRLPRCRAANYIQSPQARVYRRAAPEFGEGSLRASIERIEQLIPAKKFAGWSYHMGHVDESTVLHRSGDIDGRHTGNWWSTDAPTSIEKVRSEKALPETWPNGSDSKQNSGLRRDSTRRCLRIEDSQQLSVILTVLCAGVGGNQTYVPDGWSHADVFKTWPLAP